MADETGPEKSGDVEHTPDGRYIVVDGRRWRATDPSIPEALRVQLVRELMAARRAVGLARTDDAVSAARARVHDAKVALGERGTPWWESAAGVDAERAAATARALLRSRASSKTICPSDVARVVASPTWRPHMPAIREILNGRVQAEELELRQRGQRVPPGATVRGPVRYGRGPGFPVT